MHKNGTSQIISIIAIWINSAFIHHASFLLCKELVPGYLDEITGEYATPEGYLVDEQDEEGFDKQFS